MSAPGIRGSDKAREELRDHQTRLAMQKQYPSLFVSCPWCEGGPVRPRCVHCARTGKVSHATAKARAKELVA